MNRRRRSSNRRPTTQSKKIIRCKQKMMPVFDQDTCEQFTQKTSADTTKICKNCVHAF